MPTQQVPSVITRAQHANPMLEVPPVGAAAAHTANMVSTVAFQSPVPPIGSYGSTPDAAVGAVARTASQVALWYCLIVAGINLALGLALQFGSFSTTMVFAPSTDSWRYDLVSKYPEYWDFDWFAMAFPFFVYLLLAGVLAVVAHRLTSSRAPQPSSMFTSSVALTPYLLIWIGGVTNVLVVVAITVGLWIAAWAVRHTPTRRALQSAAAGATITLGLGVTMAWVWFGRSYVLATTALVALVVMALVERRWRIKDRGFTTGAPVATSVPTLPGAVQTPNLMPLYAADGSVTGYVPMPTGPSEAPGASESTNGLAIAGFILGLLGFVLFAWIFGGIALHQISRSEGRQGGKGLAIAGIVLGFVWTFAVVALLVALNAGISSMA